MTTEVCELCSSGCSSLSNGYKGSYLQNRSPIEDWREINGSTLIMAQATMLILSALIASSLGAVCTYNRASGKIACGSWSCFSTTVGSKVPAGYYYLGDGLPSSNPTKFEMYKAKSGGSGFWHYNSLIPEQSCEGSYELVANQQSDTSITVTNGNCWINLRNVIGSYSVIPFSVQTCNGCSNGVCQNGISSSLAPCTVDLQVLWTLLWLVCTCT